MDFESILVVVLCALACISIAVLVIRRIKESITGKRIRKEAVKSAMERPKSADKASEASTPSRVRTAPKPSTETKPAEKKPATEKKAPEKKSEPEKKPEPKKAPEKKPSSRVKTDPAFTEKKATEKPKPKVDMEKETLLKAEKGKRDYWKCYYCGTENNKSHGRCVVCTQEKPPTGI